MSSTKMKIPELKEKIKEVQFKIKELVEQNKNNVEIELFFLENDEKFYAEYPYLIKKLIKGGSLEFLDTILENLEKVQNGEQALASTELKLSEQLAEEFLYPNLKKDD